jgi:serine/threonine-protein kinase RsbW
VSPRAFSMPARIDAVDPMALALKAEATAYLSPEKLMAFEIAVVEALTNIVVHGAARLSVPEVSVAFAADAEAVRLEITDAGPPAPAGVYDQAPSLDDIDIMAESGRGISLILACADAVHYSRQAGINHLQLVFARGGGG